MPLIFQTLTVPSSLPEIRVLPSGLKTIDQTGARCPLKVRNSSPLRVHILIILSLPAEAILLPSGLKLTSRKPLDLL